MPSSPKLTESAAVTEAAAAGGEDPDYLSRQLITYLGNKRLLLPFIGQGVERVRQRLGKDRLNVFDAFSGSGIVSRYLKASASRLLSNDAEQYAAVIGDCFLRNRSEVDGEQLAALVDRINARVEDTDNGRGFIEELYAPLDDDRILAGERVFYTRENARRLDRYRRLIEEAPPEMQNLLLGPLLSKASVHANTSGVFKGFYKDRATGVGRFGGTAGDALNRITGRIVLEPPVFSRFECEVDVRCRDANELADELSDIDLTYIDPPYNQHPYGSNYFMLNLLVGYRRPETISDVSGIPTDWQRSGYNVRSRADELLFSLLSRLDSKFLLVSFNDEGFVSPGRMRQMLAKLGEVEVLQVRYNAFRGSRNLRSRPIHVMEQLFLVEKR